MQIALDDLSANNIYHLMTQTLIPRPIAWVMTNSGSKQQPVLNLAPFSYFTPISSNPPMVLFSVGNKEPGVAKDTVTNLRNNPQLTLHIATVSQAETVTKTSATLPLEQSEVNEFGIETVHEDGFALPRVKGAPIAIDAELVEIKEVGDAPQHLVIVKLKRFWVSDDVIDSANNRLIVDALAINPLSRLGGSQYANLDAPFSIARPQ